MSTRSYLAGLVGLALLIAVFMGDLRYELRAYALLNQFAGRGVPAVALVETHLVRTQELSIRTLSGLVRARLFLPIGVDRPKGMVAVHGMHHLGIDEPRLVGFARATATTGLAVLTPELPALADYHVDQTSIATIGDSAAWLDARLGSPVTVTGISFAGGLSLLAACDPRFAPQIRALVLMGGYDDLGRVSRFLATDSEEFPGDKTRVYKAHDYGASVFVYAHLPKFFAMPDLPAAHEALRDWLWERPDEARRLLAQLSPAGRATIEALVERRIEAVRPQMLDVIQSERSELAALSPRGHMENLRMPVFLLHGASDNVIPPAESLWLAKDIPTNALRAVLITGAFSHVDPEKRPRLAEELRLIHFVAGILREAGD